MRQLSALKQGLQFGQNRLRGLGNGSSEGEAGGSRVSTSAKLDGDARNVQGSLRAQVATHDARFNLTQEQAQLGAVHLANDIDESVALRRLDATLLKIAGVGVTVRHPAPRMRLNATHDD